MANGEKLNVLAARECRRSREVEAFPVTWSVGVRALRCHSDARAERLRDSVPRLLAGIAAEIPGGVLGYRMHCGSDGLVSVDVTITADGLTEAIGGELEAVLRPVGDTFVQRQERARLHPKRWPLVSDTARGFLGFASEAGPDRQPLMAFPAAGEGDVAGELLEVVATIPGEGVHVSLRPAGGAGDRWEAQVMVLTAVGEPSLRLKAALRRLFPGMRVADSRAAEAARLQVTTAELPRLSLVPVAGTKLPAGVCIAEAAPVAVVPAYGAAVAETESGIRIGYATTESGHQHHVELSVTERLRHLHVLGRTGTGKSSLLAALVHGIATSGDGALIADPHGTLCDRILAELPEAARERVWLIRCGDVDNPVPLNPLAETDPIRRDFAIEEICEYFQYLFDKGATGIVGPRFRERVGMALRAMSARFGETTSLLDVPVALADDTFMTAAVGKCADARVKAWWANDRRSRSSNDYGEMVSWVNSKFEAFAGTAAMRAILGSGANAIDFPAAMDAGRIILLDLSKAQLGEPASRLLGYLYLGRIWAGALRRTDRDRPFHVIVDEAHTLISGAMTNMLAEGRKFGVSVTLAHQYFSQLDDDLRPAVDGNVGTTVAFRCAVSDAAEMSRRFGGLVDPAVMMTLPDLAAITLRTAGDTVALPHTLHVDHNREVSVPSDEKRGRLTREVLQSTCVELVEFFRPQTATAAKGRSRISGSRGSANRKPAVEPGMSGFLDSWLEDRFGSGSH
jgi:hypothetical protein